LQHRKNIYAGFIAILAVIVLSTAACKNSSKEDGGGGAGGDFDYIALGDSLTITGYKGKGGSVTIPGTIDGITVRHIRYDAFANHANITGVTIPNSVKDIGDKAFYNCTGLASLTIQSSSIYISTEVFSGCTKLTSVKIQGEAQIIPGAFLGNFNEVFYANDDDGTPGTYTTTAPVSSDSKWNKAS